MYDTPRVLSGAPPINQIGISLRQAPYHPVTTTGKSRP